MLFVPVFDVLAVTKVSCGNVMNIPKKIPELTNLAITLIQVAVPIVLVVMSALDFFKSMSSGKEDEIKKHQKMFIKRLIVAIIIFFIIAIVKVIVSIVADSSSATFIECIDCFLGGVENCK